MKEPLKAWCSRSASSWASNGSAGVTVGNGVSCEVIGIGETEPKDLNDNVDNKKVGRMKRIS